MIGEKSNYMGNFINLIIVFLLVFLNGFFVAAEFAIVKIRPSKIETLVLSGKNNAGYVKKIAEDLNSYLSACQFGITLSSLGLGWIGEPTIVKILDPLFNYFRMEDVVKHTVSFIIGFSIITAVHIILGDLVPKSLAIINAEKVAMLTARPLLFFYKVSYPVIWLFDKSTNLILKIFGVKDSHAHEEVHTNDEILLLLQESYNHGFLNKESLTLMDNVFDFSEKNVTSVMIPRTEMACISKNDDFNEIVKFMLEGKYTRYPVYTENKDNIIGFIHIRDICKQEILNQEKNLDEIIREIIFVPVTMPVSSLFKKFQMENSQIAIAIDEYGGTAGMITFEDILEELVGDIQDEFDLNDDSEIKKFSEYSYSVNGKIPIDRINKLLNINIETNVETIGGLFSSEYGLLPEIGQKISHDGYKFTVTKSDGRRALRVKIDLLNEKEQKIISS